MINFLLEKGKFNYRIAGILMRDEKVLFHKEQHDEHWSLPGGRAEMLEDSKETLIREFQEELNCEVEVQNLQFVVENFFVHNQLDYHELGFIYHVHLKDGDIPNHQFTVVEEGVTYFFKWFTLEELENLAIKPGFLRTAITPILAPEIQHVIQR